MKARFEGTCTACGQPIAVGQLVARGWQPRTWGHAECVEHAWNKELILSGETFAAHKPSEHGRRRRRDGPRS